MVFEIGKYYKHSGGGMLHIVSSAKTTMWGWTTIAETNDARLQPVGNDETSATNYIESTEEEWVKNFS